MVRGGAGRPARFYRSSESLPGAGPIRAGSGKAVGWQVERTPSTRFLAFVDDHSNLIVRHTLEHAPDVNLQPQPNNVRAIAVGRSGRVAIVGGAGELQVTSAADTARLAPRSDERGALASVAFSPDETWVATGNSVGEVSLWKLDTNEPRRVLKVGNDHTEIAAIAFSDDKQSIAASTQDPFNYNAGLPGLVLVWDWRSGARRTYRGHANSVQALAFVPGSRVLVSARRTAPQSSGMRARTHPSSC